MEKNVSKKSKLKLLKILEEELETHKTTVENLIRNNQIEKERYSSANESGEDNLTIINDCEHAIRRLTKNLEELNKNLDTLKVWRKEISEKWIVRDRCLPIFYIYNYILANLSKINIYLLFMNILP